MIMHEYANKLICIIMYEIKGQFIYFNLVAIS